MKDLFPLIDPHVITNKKGKELGVFIEMKDYKLLLDHIGNLSLCVIAYNNIKTSHEGSTSLEDIKKELICKRKNVKNKLL